MERGEAKRQLRVLGGKNSLFLFQKNETPTAVVITQGKFEELPFTRNHPLPSIEIILPGRHEISYTTGTGVRSTSVSDRAL